MEPPTRIKQEPGIKTDYMVNTNSIIPNTAGSMDVAVKTERLQSFRMPRDLTLTNGRATKPPANKKVYTPNLNAVRNKNTDVKTASTGPKSRVKTDRSKNDKDLKNRKASLIQTSGIFSDGLAQRAPTRASKYDRSGSSKEPGESIRKPVFARTETKMDWEDEKKRLKHLYDDEEDDVADIDRKMEIGLKLPVKLESDDYKAKPEVKTEIIDDARLDPFTLAESLVSNPASNNIFLLQLPDALPGKCDSGEKQTVNGHEIKTEAPQAATTEEAPQYCTVRDLDEGCVGKIIRYRSGKVKLMLGKILFDISLGMDTGFLQELVSINVNQTERSGNIINISTIKAKLNASPDWEYLFKNST
ncbi:DNA-directed RNA polymerase III subunit RPC4 [Anopheles ziemanni]|uniref:DNA-directed RNA polymerase III subunit RPC4 n=1 Tax=Anopheles coustani TaxID=139045 RepID=UPI00265B1976|nr:DNA-directed RNA polymerase III subunit RPC4 [Anopheles coustani]XP_058172931.1 DNA-directed RNA polymerase III subunit RPC4 [Anopheles ziemanni]